MYSSHTAVIQKIALHRVGSLVPGTVQSMSASTSGERLLVRTVVQTGLPDLHLNQMNDVLSKIVEDLKFVFGRQWSVCSEMIESSPADEHALLEIAIFDCRNTPNQADP